jgi:uncharacterized repeat protein (TIGR01451 family)
MRIAVTTCLVLGLALTLASAPGCGEKRTGTVPMPPPKTSETRPASPPSTPPSTPPRTTERTPPAPPPDAVPPGMSRVRHYEPAGKAAASPFLVERLAPKEVRAGQPFEYTLMVTNLSDKDLAEVTLKELIPDNTTIRSTDPDTTSKTDTHLVWRYRQLKAGQTARATVQAVASKTGLVTPCVEVTYRPTAVCVGINVVQPKLELVKTAPESALVCEVIPLTLTVRNAGTGDAENVVIRDPLPKGMTSLDGESTLVLQAGTLQPGQSKRFTEKVKVASAGTYANTATAQAGGGLDASSAKVSTEVHQPMLAVTKKGPETRYVGTPVKYTITVSNTGKVPATKTVLSDTVPDGAAFTSASAGGTHRGGNVVWNLGTIPAGEKRNVTVTLQAQQAATLRSTASVKAVCCEAAETTTTLVKGIPAILLECVDERDPIEIGANETYVITVTNQGSAVGTNIRVTCTLPAEQTYVSSDGPTRATADGKTVTFAPLARLAPKAKATYRVVVKGTKTGDVRFAVELTSDQMTSPAGETESTHIYE